MNYLSPWASLVVVCYASWKFGWKTGLMCIVVFVAFSILGHVLFEMQEKD